MVTISEDRFKQLLQAESELNWVKEYAIYQGNIRNLDKKVADYILNKIKKFPDKLSPLDYAENEFNKYINDNRSSK